jgi:nitrite reductase/ring-hydroxylating ferredoxin subunit
VRPKSKIRFFLIASALVLALSACNKKNDVIPDVTVDFALDINDPEFATLAGTGTHVIITSKTNNWGYRSAGYNDNGIIVYSSDLGLYNAYDRTCPHDYSVNGLSIKVNIDFTMAVCPKCGTTYALSAGGTPASGLGRFPLKNYKTSFDGRYIRVWN